MALSNVQLSRVYTSDALGAGTRTVSATVNGVRTVGTPDAITVRVSVSQLTNMTPEELEDYQTFINGLDEFATLVEELIALDTAA